MSSVSGEPFSLPTADGRKLSARYWPGRQAAERSVLFLPGLAAPQAYLRFLAGFLASEGWGAMTFDYRSAGASADPAADRLVTADDWVNLDLPAAIREIRRRASPRFLAVFAHSIGGQLLGQSPALDDTDGVLLIAAQRGIPKLFHGMARVRIEYAYAVFPALIGLLGRLPKSKMTLPETCAGGALLQWVRWGRSGVFSDVAGRSMEARFGQYRGPLVAVSIADDQNYAPPEAVEALTGLYANARIRREVLSPADYGLPRLGHFGMFHPRAPRSLWSQVDVWLRQLESARLPGDVPTSRDEDGEPDLSESYEGASRPRT